MRAVCLFGRMYSPYTIKTPTRDELYALLSALLCSFVLLSCSTSPQVFLFLFNDMLLITKGDARKDRFQVMAKFMREDHVRLEIMADTDGSFCVSCCASLSFPPVVSLEWYGV